MRLIDGITSFDDSPPPPGESQWVPGSRASSEVRIVAYDASWPAQFELLAARISTVLGSRVVALEHVGSTSVPGLAAKPVIDVDLTLADPAAESLYVPELEREGFRLTVREPWWFQHRMLRRVEPACHLHVWPPDCAEAARHLIFRDWLRAHPEECELYTRAKRAASAATLAAAGDGMDYNARKQDAIRQIYARAFRSLGLE